MTSSAHKNNKIGLKTTQFSASNYTPSLKLLIYVVDRLCSKALKFDSNTSTLSTICYKISMP